MLCSSNLVDEKRRKRRRENGVVGRGSVGEKFQVSFLLFMPGWGVRGLVNHGFYHFLIILFARWGWLADGTVRYPMHTKSPNCGNAIGLHGSSSPIDKETKRNAWCYRPT